MKFTLKHIQPTGNKQFDNNVIHPYNKIIDKIINTFSAIPDTEIQTENNTTHITYNTYSADYTTAQKFDVTQYIEQYIEQYNEQCKQLENKYLDVQNKQPTNSKPKPTTSDNNTNQPETHNQT